MIFSNVTSDCLVVFCFEYLSFCLFCLWVHTDSRPMPRESGLSLHPPWLFLCLVFPLACAQRGREGHCLCSPELQQLPECRAEVKGTCVRLRRELQLQVRDCEWCSHHRQLRPTLCSRATLLWPSQAFTWEAATATALLCIILHRSCDYAC